MTARHASLSGPLIIIGCGSIAQGLLPLLERHISYDRSRCTIIEPNPEQAGFLRRYGVRHLALALTPDNFQAVLGPLLPEGTGFVLNLSVNVSSYALMLFCQER